MKSSCNLRSYYRGVFNREDVSSYSKMVVPSSPTCSLLILSTNKKCFYRSDQWSNQRMVYGCKIGNWNLLDFLLDQWWYIDVFLLHSHFSHVQVILTLIIACFMETLQWSLEMRSLYWKKGPCLVFILNSYYLQVAAIFCFYKISFSLRNFVMILNKVWKDQGKIFASVGIFY